MYSKENQADKDHLPGPDIQVMSMWGREQEISLNSSTGKLGMTHSLETNSGTGIRPHLTELDSQNGHHCADQFA